MIVTYIQQLNFLTNTNNLPENILLTNKGSHEELKTIIGNVLYTKDKQIIDDFL